MGRCEKTIIAENKWKNVKFLAEHQLRVTNPGREPGPVDVQLDCDNRTMVQPDLLILCNMDQIKNGVVYGAPDLVVEVLSPSTKKKDRTIKLNKYRKAGVREYWIIDLEREEVEVYCFRNPEFITLPRVYGFGDVIPVEIYDGECKVDFSDVSRWG